MVALRMEPHTHSKHGCSPGGAPRRMRRASARPSRPCPPACCRPHEAAFPPHALLTCHLPCIALRFNPTPIHNSHRPPARPPLHNFVPSQPPNCPPPGAQGLCRGGGQAPRQGRPRGASRAAWGRGRGIANALSGGLLILQARGGSAQQLQRFPNPGARCSSSRLYRLDFAASTPSQLSLETCIAGVGRRDEAAVRAQGPCGHGAAAPKGAHSWVQMCGPTGSVSACASCSPHAPSACPPWRRRGLPTVVIC